MTPDARYPVRHAPITRAGRRGDNRGLTAPPTDEAYARGCARVLQQLGAWLDAVLGARYDE